MKIIDSFVFNNELEILDLRLNILSEVVDYYILVEADHTQSLIPKPFYFEENKLNFKSFSDKIIHIKVADCPESNSHNWEMENFQRNCIIRGIVKLSFLKNDDILLVSDVDEIPNLNNENLQILKNMKNLISFEMDYNPFYVNLCTQNKKWIGTIATIIENLKYVTPQKLRDIKNNVDIIKNGGNHFGYSGGKNKIYQKFFSCIEPYDKSKIPDFNSFSKEFDRKIKDGGSFLFSDKNDDSIKLIKYDESKLPKYLIENKEKFKHLFYESK